jgi:hypothetical protein
MKIKHSDNTYFKPKNFSRNVLICSCLCPIVPSTTFYADKMKCELVKVKYEVKPNKESYYSSSCSNRITRNHWSNSQYWGEFVKVVELPPIFDKLDEEDFIVKTSYFTRDDQKMPGIYEIEIVNYKKYELIKLKEERTRKLNNLKTS